MKKLFLSLFLLLGLTTAQASEQAMPAQKNLATTIKETVKAYADDALKNKTAVALNALGLACSYGIYYAAQNIVDFATLEELYHEQYLAQVEAENKQ